MPPTDYNLLLGHSWIHTMMAVVSSIFRVIMFPHQDKIITINQLDYCTPETSIHSNVPLWRIQK